MPVTSSPRETSGSLQPIWIETAAPQPHRPALVDGLEADVCVIGGGIAGLSTAYLLAKEGRRVVVLEDGEIGSGETGRTTAHLTAALDDRYFEIERLHGESGARLAAESHAAAIDRYESMILAEGIPADFRRVDGWLFVQPGHGDLDELRRELEACHRAGLLGVEWAEQGAPLPFATGPALRFPRQARIHAMHFLSGLAEAVERHGGRIFCGTHVVGIEDGRPARVTTAAGSEVLAGDIVVATNSPVSTRLRIHTKQASYRTYVIAAEPASSTVPDALFWDTGSPYHYLRLAAGKDGRELLVIGGEDHKTGQAEDDEAGRFETLETWARERFPGLGPVSFRWSGQILEPVDAMAFIGLQPPAGLEEDDRGEGRAPERARERGHVFLATGDSGNGMTHGMIAGMLLSDLILGRPNPWAELYDPSRISLRASARWSMENANVVPQYADWLTPGDSSEAEIAPGDGAVVRHGLRKLAVHRDERGQLHRLDATCPHLGCVVSWNGAEKSWDCPCHGSRFAASGDVINGPANCGLSRVDEDGGTLPEQEMPPDRPRLR